MMRKWMNLPTLFLSFYVIAGCSGHNDLDRSEAARRIAGSSRLGTTAYLEFGVGKFNGECSGTPAFGPDSQHIMANAGLTTLRDFSWDHGGITFPVPACEVQLTADGVERSRQWTSSVVNGITYYKIPIAISRLGEITGVAVDPNRNTATAQFTWLWANTEQGRALGLSFPTGNGTASFRRYDDGWRMEEIYGLSEAPEHVFATSQRISRVQTPVAPPQQNVPPVVAPSTPSGTSVSLQRSSTLGDWFKAEDQGRTSLALENGTLHFFADRNIQSRIVLLNKKKISGGLEYFAEINHKGYGRTSVGIWSETKQRWAAWVDLDTDDTNVLSFGAGNRSTESKYRGTPYMNRWVRVGVQIMGEQASFSVDGKWVEMLHCDPDSGPRSVGIAVGSVPWKSGPNDTEFRLISLTSK